METMTKTGEIDLFVTLLQTKSHAELEHIMAKTPYAIGHNAISKHKAGRCVCFR